MALVLLIIVPPVLGFQVVSRHDVAISAQTACLWLLERQNADGSWGGSLSEQARLTPLVLYALLSCDVPKGARAVLDAIAWVELNKLRFSDVSSKSRVISSLYLAGKGGGGTSTYLMNSLQNSQRPNGSWDDEAESTTLAVIAAKNSNDPDIGSKIQEASEFLFRYRVNETWAWELPSEDVDGLSTACHVIIGISEAGRYNQSLDEVVSWILFKRDAEGSWDGDVASTSLAIWALSEWNLEAPQIDRSLDWLISNQEESGGWGSIEDTALVLVSLHKIVGSVPAGATEPAVSHVVAPDLLALTIGLSGEVNVTFSVEGGLALDSSLQIGSHQDLRVEVLGAYVNEGAVESVGEPVMILETVEIGLLAPEDVLTLSLRLTATVEKDERVQIPVTYSYSTFAAEARSNTAALPVQIARAGTPNVRVGLSSIRTEVVEGEYTGIYLSVENAGTAPALLLNISLSAQPPDIAEIRGSEGEDLGFSLERLDPGERTERAYVLGALSPGEATELLTVKARVEYFGGEAQETMSVLIKRTHFLEKHKGLFGPLIGAIAGVVLTTIVQNKDAIRAFVRKLRRKT